MMRQKEKALADGVRKHHLLEAINEPIESISKKLTLNLVEGEGKAYLICSALRDEGCSTIACALAHSMALSRNESVVIVDANMRFPSVHEYFSLPREDGLVDVLSGEVKPEVSIKKTSVKNLFVVTNGNPSTSKESIFETKKFIDYLSFLRANHQFVIFDSSPIITYMDSLSLGKYMDGIILVVEAERTRREVILKAKEILQKEGNPIVGVVLNKRRYHIPGFIYRRLT